MCYSGSFCATVNHFHLGNKHLLVNLSVTPQLLGPETFRMPQIKATLRRLYIEKFFWGGGHAPIDP